MEYNPAVTLISFKNLHSLKSVSAFLSLAPKFGIWSPQLNWGVQYGNWKYGIRSEGLISSAQSIGSKIGIGIGSALTGWILASVGYNPAAEPTAAVINAVKFDYTWMGAILGVVILVIVLLLDVEKYADQYNS